MEEQLNLYDHGSPCGTLLRQVDGLHILFTADCPAGEGVRKIWLKGEGGGSLLLGTLVPEQGRWRLRRHIAHSELRRLGLDEAVWGEIHSPWEGEPHREVLPVTPEDTVIAAALSRWSGRWRRRGSCWRLSYPWRVGERVPMETLFCFARVEGGELYYLLDGRGFPTGMDKTSTDGAE